MLRTLFIFLAQFFIYASFAANITGTITDDKGNPLAYASITVKGTTRGTTANGSGKYALNLDPGSYTLVCQYVGYSRSEKAVTVSSNVTLDFTLKQQELTLGEVVIKQGEDPAYEIIRQAIRKRNYYNNQVDSFTVDVYIKGLIRSRGLPQKFFGQKVERNPTDGLDSAGKGIIFLSESLTKVAYKNPGKFKYEVVSSRASGGGFGLSFPVFVNFYQNNVAVFDNSLNPRGFVSPIADGAMNYYRFKYQGSFVEDNKMVNTIQVIPKRKNEPLFSGTIQIIEDDWRIYSLDLLTTSAYQLELADTLRVSQLHTALTQDTWKTKNQVIYVTMKKLGFDMAGSFVNVYTDYNLVPAFKRNFFDRVLMKYDTAFNKKDTSYWSRTRPVALETDEKRDFIFKDSVSKVFRDSFYTRTNLDSLRRSNAPVTVKGVLWSGVTKRFFSKSVFTTYRLSPLIKRLQYNTVEGLSIHLDQSLSFNPRKGKYNYRLSSYSQYGLSNAHFNSSAEFLIRKRQSIPRQEVIQFGGGKRLSQFNPDEPISPLMNSLFTLLYKENYMKVYENWFGTASYANRYASGLTWKIYGTWEDRIPVENSTDFSLFRKEHTFLPNHPYELANTPFTRQQAMIAGVAVSWQPGQRYIEYPWGKRAIGSNAPTFEVSYDKGIKNVLGSDVDYDKWKFSIADDIDLKLRGEFKYRVSIGGFINDNSVGIPDLRHFNGNQTFTNRRYLNSFQLAPYYRYSNSEKLYGLVHAEHHFNGLLSNKIPLFNKLKWYFVAGTNAFYVNRNNYYVEAFGGIENIAKLFRIDFINAYQPGLGNKFGVRIGLGGLLGGKVKSAGADENSASINSSTISFD